MVRANFAPIWKVLGSDEIGGWATSNDANPIENISSNLGYIDIALEGNKTYTFKLYNQQTGAWFGLQTATSYTFDASVNKTTWQTTAVTLYNSDSGTPKGPNNFSFTTGGKGIYRFYYNISTHSFYLKCPASYKITFGKGTGGITITASGSTTGSINNNGYVASGEDVTFTETHTTPGYTFTGWYTTKDTGGSAVSGMSTSDFVLDNVTANKTVYSRYSENMTTVNLVASPTGKGTFTKGGATVTSVKAGKTTRPEVTAVPATGYRVNTSATVWAKSNSNITLSSTTANPVTVTGCGTASTSSNLTATFTPKTYTITLHEQGATTSGTPGDGGTITATYDASTNLSTITALPERTGYTFGGYYPTAECDGTWIIKTDRYFNWDGTYLDSEEGFWKYDGNVNLYAKWTANQYTVMLDVEEANKGTTTGATTSQDIYYDDATVTVPNLPTANLMDISLTATIRSR